MWQLWSPLAQKKPPSPYKETFITITKAFVYMGIHLYMSGAFPLSYTLTPEYLEWGFWHRAFYQYLGGLTARWKYYFVWSLSEAAVMISGFGFSGWTKDPEKESKPKWTRAKNIDVLNVEFATSAAEIPKYWNIHVSVWLRYCILEKCRMCRYVLRQWVVISKVPLLFSVPFQVSFSFVQSTIFRGSVAAGKP